MRRWFAVGLLAFGLSCSGSGLTPVQTAQVVTTATASVLQLVAQILAAVSAQAEAQAAKCLQEPAACVLPADPTPDPLPAGDQ